MLGYDKTLKVLDLFYESCIEFWLGEGKDWDIAHELSMRDINGITTNPFSPCGEPLDLEAKEKFFRQHR